MMGFKADLMTPHQATKKTETFLQEQGFYYVCFFCLWTIIMNRIKIILKLHALKIELDSLCEASWALREECDIKSDLVRAWRCLPPHLCPSGVTRPGSLLSVGASAYSYLHDFIWKDTRNLVTLVNFGKRNWMTERLYFFGPFLNFKTSFQKYT